MKFDATCFGRYFFKMKKNLFLLKMLVAITLLTGPFSLMNAHGAGFSNYSSGISGVAPLASARYHHTSTLLPNGKILVAGGQGSSGVVLATAELYDPATNKWSPTTGNMSTPRFNHTATLLPNGKVLVAGGQGNNLGLTLASAELYDPAADTWSSAGSMASPRFNHTATLLVNGKLLVAGGQGNSYGLTLSSAELYDPAAKTWSPTTGNMKTPRYGHTATLITVVTGDKVLLAGGSDGSTVLDSAELYDPVAGTWSFTAGMTSPRINHTATLLPNGIVLVAGGDNGSTILNSSELYDPDAGPTWSLTDVVMTSSRYNHTATLLPDGTVLVAGGRDGDNNALVDAEIYDYGDPDADTWSPAGSMKTSRYHHTATLLPSGKVILAGGFTDGSSHILASAESYDPVKPGWRAAHIMNTDRNSHTATILTTGKVLLAGGGSNSDSAETYDQDTDAWTSAASMNSGRFNHTATLLPSGKVLVAGGSDGSTTLKIAELSDPDPVNPWTPTGSMNVLRKGHTATLLPNGKVLVTGGNNGTDALLSAELYIPAIAPADGAWSLAASMSFPRNNHTATLLPNGKVLVTGGSNGSTVLASAELYDPAGNTWSSAGSMASPRFNHTATLLPGGRVLIAGGDNGNDSLASAELYDPDGNTWLPAKNMGAARERHTATLLPGGKVLVAGGFNYSSDTLDSTELYDPAIKTWSPAGSLGFARESHTATLLPDGNVLVAGGYDGVNNLISADLFDTGLDFISSRDLPKIDSRDPLVLTGLSLAGSDFLGDSEASGGATNSSSTAFPLVQLQRVDNDLTTFLLDDPAASWSKTSFVSQSLSGLPVGYYRATVYASAVPSNAFLILIAPTASLQSDNEIEFDDTPKGDTPKSETITIKNTGSGDLVITPGPIDSPFTLAEGIQTLASGKTGTYTVTLPTTAPITEDTTYSGEVKFMTNDPANPVITVSLSGTVTLPPPTIGGTPASSVNAGSNYSFTPVSTNAASFTISGQPLWLKDTTVNGTLTLSGTPVNADIGMYGPIIITAINDTGASEPLTFSISVAISDTTNPVVTKFTLPRFYNSKTVPVTITAKDNATAVADLAYLITESTTAPLASDPGWSKTKPANYTFAKDGNMTLYAWVKDTAGNMSKAAKKASVMVDITPPVVSLFQMPAASRKLTIPVTALIASDNNVKIAGYMITESDVAPAADDARWRAGKPASFTTSSTDGPITLYAWVKDAANNVSSAALPVDILIDTEKPTVTDFQVAPLSGLTVEVPIFAGDDTLSGVVAYMITQSSKAPSATSKAWITEFIPTSYTFSSGGSKTLYAWVKDQAGNVSAVSPTSTAHTLIDNKKPVVTAFQVSTRDNNLAVHVNNFTATDNLAVSSYLITESATVPADTEPWSPTPQTDYTFIDADNKTLYAWAKDIVGNISKPRIVKVTVAP
jgi:N-acetylneuraminic acid mutarotase